MIIIPSLPETESDIGIDIPHISSDIIGIANLKNWYIRFIKILWQLDFLVGYNKIFAEGKGWSLIGGQKYFKKRGF